MTGESSCYHTTPRAKAGGCVEGNHGGVMQESPSVFEVCYYMHASKYGAKLVGKGGNLWLEAPYASTSIG